MNFLRLCLWILPHFLLLICLLRLLRFSRYRDLPAFFIYVVVEEAQFGVLLAVSLLTSRAPGALVLYQWLIVANVATSSCLQIAVLYEIARKLILPDSAIWATLKPVVRWIAAILLLLAVGLSAAFADSGLHRVYRAFEVVNFCANLINVGFLLALLVFTRVLHISWKSLPAGIVLGFGVISSAEMGATSLLSAFGTGGVIPGDMLRLAAFSVCSMIWLVYLLLPERTPEFVGAGLRKSEIESWDQELRRMVKP